MNTARRDGTAAPPGSVDETPAPRPPSARGSLLLILVESGWPPLWRLDTSAARRLHAFALSH
ncbi:hypothetical protein ACWDZX_30740, partial [Streptomyces collinus]